MNPYQPPAKDLRYPSFAKRFRHALQRASAEYRRGLRREQISTVRHVQSWLALLMLVLVGAFIIIVWTHYFFESVGILSL